MELTLELDPAGSEVRRVPLVLYSTFFSLTQLT